MSDPNFPSAVFYCDAGFMMDRKSMYNHKANLASVGIHGYTYCNEEPKKGTGSPKVIPTDKGYIAKEISEGVTKVTIGEYVDMSMGVPTGYVSSNQAELRAFIETLKWILSEGTTLTSIRIFSDSKYTVTGTNVWIEKWKVNGWRSSNGDEIKYRNMWEEVGDLVQLVKRQAVDGFELAWVRGHNGDVGNEAADALATKGLALAANSNEEMTFKISVPGGYWKVDNEAPRILQAPRWYMSTTDLDYKDDQDRTIYYIGCHGSKDKEDALVGKRYADNFLGVVKVNDPDPVMESMRQLYLKSDRRALSEILITHLDVMFSPKQYRELKEIGWNYTIDMYDRIEKLNSSGAVIVTEMDPKGQGFRMVDVWTNLKNVLGEVYLDHDGYEYIDIHDMFYDIDPKKDIFKIKPSMTQMVKYIDIQAPFDLSKRKEEKNPVVKKIRLVMGSDILTRNQLAAVAPDVECIKLVTWRESDEVGRYATYIKLKNGDHGLWCRYDSNYTIVKK